MPVAFLFLAPKLHEQEKIARTYIADIQTSTNACNMIQEKAEKSPSDWTWATPLLKEYVDLENKLNETMSPIKAFVNDFKASAISPSLMRSLGTALSFLLERGLPVLKGTYSLVFSIMLFARTCNARSDQDQVRRMLYRILQFQAILVYLC